LFDNLEFASNRRERLYAVLDFGEADIGDSEKPTEGFTVDVTVPEVGEVATWIDEHLRVEDPTEQAPVGVALVSTWGQGTGRVDALALVAPTGVVVYVDTTTLDPADTAALVAFLSEPERPKAVHEYTGAVLALGAQGWSLQGVGRDTVL